jgi:ATP-binding cassette subfamily B protein
LLIETGLDHDPGCNYGKPAPGSFEERVLEVRKKVIGSDSSARMRWEAVESEGICNGLTVRENLLRGRCHPRRRDAVEQTDRVIRSALTERKLLEDALLLGLEFRAGEDGNFLSGGQRQKLAMARVLMKNPGILLLDEATSAMDEVSQRRIIDLIRTQFAGKTVMSISHRLTTVRDYDRIMVLDRGRMIESGNYDELAARGGIFSQLVRQETGHPASPQSPQVAPATSAATDGVHDSEIARQLSLCPLFSELRSERLGFLAQIARVFNFRAGELLFSQGDAGEEIFVILDGEVEFFKPNDSQGDEKPVNRFGSGRAFGELAVCGQGVRALSARAAAPSRVAAIGREQLLPLMSAEPQIGLAMLKALSQRLVELTEARTA